MTKKEHKYDNVFCRDVFQGGSAMVARLIIGIALLGLVAGGCASNKQLIAEKDMEIKRLKTEISQLKDQAQSKTTSEDDLTKQLNALASKEKIWIEEKQNMTTINVPNAVLFTSGSVKLSDEGKRIIDEVWKILAKYPNREVLIQGHTDNVPIASKFEGRFKSNWELSSSRAHSVLHYVLTKPDAKPKRLAAAGYGEFRPIADNKTEEGKAKNRRVVIAILGAGA